MMIDRVTESHNNLADQAALSADQAIRSTQRVANQALDGGGPASTRLDPLGKGMAQLLLEMPITVPADWSLPPLVGPYR